MSSRPASTLRRFAALVVAALALVPTLIEYGGFALSPTAIDVGRAFTAAFFVAFVGGVVGGWLRSDVVGVTMGATAKLGTAGKIVISVAMLVGRIGPLSLVVAMALRKAPPDYEHPEARLMIG